MFKKFKGKMINWELKSLYDSYKKGLIDEESEYLAVNFISKLLSKSDEQYNRSMKDTLITIYLYMYRNLCDSDSIEKIMKKEWEKGKDGIFFKLLNGEESCFE